MNIISFKKKWNNKNIEDWGCYCSDEFKSFTRQFKNMLKSELGDNYNLYGFKANHYDFSGFVEKNGCFVYISYSLNRHRPINFDSSNFFDGFLVRTAKSAKDYTGGINTYTNLDGLIDRVNKLLEEQYKIAV